MPGDFDSELGDRFVLLGNRYLSGADQFPNFSGDGFEFLTSD